MVHTLPDYTTKYKTVRVFANLDHAELAARINNINTYDRRGNIIWWDDFEGSILLWDIGGSGGGRNAELSTAEPLVGSQCCKLTTGDAINNEGGIFRFFQLPTTTTLGAEISFRIWPNINLYTIQMIYYTGSTAYEGKVRYDSTNKKIQYLNSSNNWADLATGVDAKYASFLYTTMKLVCDFNLKEYKRLLFRHTTFDITGEALRSVSSSDAPGLYVQFFVTADTAGGQSTYCDRFILTENEP